MTAIVVQGPDSLEVGQRGTVTLTLHDAQGATLPLPPNGTWSISDTSVARLIGVDAGGAALETRATGVVTVTARAYAVTGARTIRVVPRSARVARAALSGLDSLEVGRQAYLYADLRDSLGALLFAGNNDAGRVTAIWTVSDTAVLRLTPNINGTDVEARAPGTVLVTLRANGVEATRTVRVLPSPANALPGLVSGAFTWHAVEAGAAHTCGLSTDGAVYCWGSNTWGQLGVVGPPEAVAAPRRVGLPVAATALSVADDRACAVGNDGAVYCWGPPTAAAGFGPEPAPGSGATTSVVRAAIAVPFVAAVAGPMHSCALTAVGDAYCWGLDEQGQVGGPPGSESCASAYRSSPYSCRRDPTRVATALRFTALVAGPYHTCGLGVDRVAYCWGATNLGRAEPLPEICRFFPRTGGGPSVVREVPCTRTPLPVAGGGRYTALSARDAVLVPSPDYPGPPTCGVRDDGVVLCWSAAQVPTAVSGVANARGVSVGTSRSTGRWHACVVTTTDAVLCWGSNAFGQLGIAGVDSSVAPRAALAPASPAAAVTAGGTHTCSVTHAGQAVCWGNPRNGRLGRSE